MKYLSLCIIVLIAFASGNENTYDMKSSEKLSASEEKRELNFSKETEFVEQSGDISLVPFSFITMNRLRKLKELVVSIVSKPLGAIGFENSESTVRLFLDETARYFRGFGIIVSILTRASKNIFRHFDSFPYLLESILIFSMLLHLFDQYLNYRQYKTFGNSKIPTELNHLVIQEDLIKSNSYSKDKMKFRIFSEFIQFIVSTSLTYFFFFPYLWNLSGRSTLLLFSFLTPKYVPQTPEYVQSLIFTFASMIQGEIISIPFNLYYDFVIEQKHGFNKKTLRLFFVDFIKTLLLQIIFGTPILCMVIWIVKVGGEYFFLWLWISVLILSFVMLIIYPNIIAPLFNKFKPLKHLELKSGIEKIASSLGFPLGKIYVIDGSKRSAHSNAYFYGFCWCKQIVIFDTLLSLDHNSILAVIGHELGHWKLRHTTKMLLVQFSQAFIYFYWFGLCVYSKNMYSSFGYSISDGGSFPIIIGLTLFMQMLSPLSTVVNLMLTLLIRRHEFQADEFSVKLGFGEDLKKGITSLHKENKGCLQPDKWYSWYHYSHPPLIERIAAIDTCQQKTLSKKKND